MKKFITLVALLVFSLSGFSQVPQQISYQAVVRSSNNTLLANAQIGVKISITNAVDSIFYSETQTTTTNAYGLFTISIGTGTAVTGAFTKINWSLGGYYIKSQIDPTGGTNYTLTGSSVISTVPYALYAANGVPNGSNSGDILYWNGSNWAILPIGSNGSTLTICNGSLHWGPCTVGNLPIVQNVNVAPTYNRIPAFLSADITSDGGSTVLTRGFCWSLNPNPTIANSTYDTVSFASYPPSVDTGGYNTVFPNLPTNGTYYCRAFATNANGTAYSTQVQISNAEAAGASLPTVLADSISLPYYPNVFEQGGPALGYTIGDVTSDGNSKITAIGFCWSLSPNPTLSDSHSTTTTFLDSTSKADTGRFEITSYFSLLDSVGTFYFRAYATNAYGTSYSNNVVVIGKKSSAGAPTVITDSISQYSAGKPIYVFGDVTSDGLVTVNKRGVCWSTSPNPTISNSFDTATYLQYPSSDTGSFIVRLDSTLLPNTTYYFRTYAYNGYAYGYGNQITVYTGTVAPYQYTLGQSYGGGYIFYIDSTGQHGLIAATSDTSTIQWYNGGYITTNATDTAVGTGLLNTDSIIKVQGTGSYAAYIAAQSSNGNFHDWYLPSIGELALMYKNLFAKGIGNFVGNYYWSSSEFNQDQAWVHDFGQNDQFSYYKNNQARVRAVRKF